MKTDISEIGISIGSNLGDRLKLLQNAIEFLRDLSSENKIEISPFYETTPLDCPSGSPLFLNAVAIIFSQEKPKILLQKLKSFELECGRPKHYERNSPRPLDLDILYFNDQIIKIPALTIPHLRIHERRFVLQPLCDLRPNLRLPGQQKTVKELLTSLKTNETLHRVENNS